MLKTLQSLLYHVCKRLPVWAMKDLLMQAHDGLLIRSRPRPMSHRIGSILSAPIWLEARLSCHVFRARAILAASIYAELPYRSSAIAVDTMFT